MILSLLLLSCQEGSRIKIISVFVCENENKWRTVQDEKMNEQSERLWGCCVYSNDEVGKKTRETERK